MVHEHSHHSGSGTGPRAGSPTVPPVPPVLSENVLAIDPGERVGWAAAELEVNHWQQRQQGVMALQDFALWLAELQNVCDIDGSPGYGKHYDVIVYETFRPRPAKVRQLVGDAMLTSQLIGMIRLVAWLTKTQLVSYGPERKSAWEGSIPEDFIQGRSGEQHDKDAQLHLWGYYFENWFDPTQEPA